MLKRNLAILVLAVALLSGGAFAWAQTGDGTSTAPTTAPSSQKAPQGRGGHREYGILQRTVHGDLIVRGKNGFENVTYDRGKEDGVSNGTLTITRPDGKKVSVKLTADTKYKGVKDASELQTGKPTIVVSRDGNALMVAQRPGDTNASPAPGHA
jgi:hypothetical protein